MTSQDPIAAREPQAGAVERDRAPPVADTAAPPPGRAPDAADAALGRRIRALRRAAGQTQKQLARQVGVTHAQLHRYEAGISRVAAGRLLAIARALDVRVEDLLGDGPDRAAGAGTEEFASLARAFAAINDPRHRAALLSLAHTMAEAGATAGVEDA